MSVPYALLVAGWHRTKLLTPHFLEAEVRKEVVKLSAADRQRACNEGWLPAAVLDDIEYALKHGRNRHDVGSEPFKLLLDCSPALAKSAHITNTRESFGISYRLALHHANRALQLLRVCKVTSRGPGTVPKVIQNWRMLSDYQDRDGYPYYDGRALWPLAMLKAAERQGYLGLGAEPDNDLTHVLHMDWCPQSNFDAWYRKGACPTSMFENSMCERWGVPLFYTRTQSWMQRTTLKSVPEWKTVFNDYGCDLSMGYAFMAHMHGLLDALADAMDVFTTVERSHVQKTPTFAMQQKKWRATYKSPVVKTTRVRLLTPCAGSTGYATPNVSLAALLEAFTENLNHGINGYDLCGPEACPPAFSHTGSGCCPRLWRWMLIQRFDKLYVRQFHDVLEKRADLIQTTNPDRHMLYTPEGFIDNPHEREVRAHLTAENMHKAIIQPAVNATKIAAHDGSLDLSSSWYRQASGMAYDLLYARALNPFNV